MHAINENQLGSLTNYRYKYFYDTFFQLSFCQVLSWPQLVFENHGWKCLLLAYTS